MKNSQKSIKRVGIMLMVMFLLCGAYLVKIVCFDRQDMMVNSYNPRINSADTTIKRGDIKDID